MGKRLVLDLRIFPKPSIQSETHYAEEGFAKYATTHL